VKEEAKEEIKVDIKVDNEDQDEDKYSKLKVDDLKAELKKRNITFNNKDKKSSLIDLLKQNDSSKPK